MDTGPAGDRTNVGYENIAIGFSFIAFDAIISQVLQLDVGTGLVVAAVRCVVQLSVMALVLQSIFDARNPWGVAGLACACSSLVY